MLNLDGLLTVKQISDVIKYTNTRFDNPSSLICPEALSLFEQGYLEKDKVKELCEKAYGIELEEPQRTYVPDKIINAFAESGVVPITHKPMMRKLRAIYLEDISHKQVSFPNYEIEYVPTTPYYYFNEYQRLYGQHSEICKIAIKTILEIVTEEAITLGASDIVFTTMYQTAAVYYNVRKRKVYSKRMFAYDDIKDLLSLLYLESPFDHTSKMPQRVGCSLTDDYRGRVEAISKYGQGYLITIRIFPRAAFDTTLEELNVEPESCTFLRKEFLNMEPGIRLIVGPTMSGKNTTILACLRELVVDDKYKIISVEQPVERELWGCEQLDCGDDEEFKAASEALIRMNPDIVYFTEMNNFSGRPAMEVGNTGKVVITTTHANTIPSTIQRIRDITGYGQDEIIQNLHSIVMQHLVRNEEEDKLYPKLVCVRFTDELKLKLYNSTLGELTQKIQEEINNGANKTPS